MLHAALTSRGASSASLPSFRMEIALTACRLTPEREFREIAAECGVDREDLQERWFDLEYGQSGDRT